MILFTLPIAIIMAAAVIPGIFLMRYIYRMDRIDKEPKSMLVKLFIAGIVSTACAVFTEGVGMRLADSFFFSDGLLYQIVTNFIVVALSEEGFKYLMLRKMTWKSPEFNCSFDGVVYAVFVSMGFAVWENIQYVFSFGLGTAVLRAVTAMPGHACFGVLMGAFYGLAKKRAGRGDEAGCAKALKLAKVVPIVAHGAYDFFASMGSFFGTIFFMAVIGVLYFFCFNLVKGLSDGDEYINNDPEFSYSDIDQNL